MLDLEAATGELTRVLGAVRYQQLDAPTPGSERLVRDLVDHMDGFALAFTAAATKTPPGDQAPRADGSRTDADWRTRIPVRLADLAAAWRESAAWEGMTRAGGLDLPAHVAGLVALDETIVHRWDLGVAIGQRYMCPDELVAAAMQFVQSAVEQNPNGSPGLFGPPVTVPDEAAPLDKLIAMTEPDSAWAMTRG